MNWKANALLLPAVVVSTWGVLENGGIGFSRSAELVTVEKCKYPWDRCILTQTQQGGQKSEKEWLLCIALQDANTTTTEFHKFPI